MVEMEGATPTVGGTPSVTRLRRAPPPPHAGEVGRVGPRHAAAGSDAGSGAGSHSSSFRPVGSMIQAKRP